MGPRTPPDTAALRREAIKLGMKAAGSAGLLAGAVLLLANNPSRGRTGRCPAVPDLPPLSHRRLLALLPGVLLTTAACAAAFAGLGYLGAFTWTSQELRLAAREGLFRPARFQCAYGIHLALTSGASSG